MVHKLSLPITLLLLFLAFSLLHSFLAVPSTRSIKSTEENPSSSGKDLFTNDAMDLNGGEEVVDFGKMFIINGRMDLENTDYPGTGANRGHDPRTPGKGKA